MIFLNMSCPTFVMIIVSVRFEWDGNCSEDWFKSPHMILINEYERMSKLIPLIYL